MKTTQYLLIAILMWSFNVAKSQIYTMSNEGHHIVHSGIFESGSLGLESKTIVLKSNAERCIQINFDQFDLGLTGALMVYQGDSVNSALLIGSYAGTNAPEFLVGDAFAFVYTGAIINLNESIFWSAKIKETDCPDNTRQINSATNSDCIGALSLCSSGDILPTGQYTDNGSVNDEIGSCFTAGGGSLQSAWFSFTPQTAGNLTFTIAPTGSADYDYVLYDITSGCASKTQLSCNFSAEYGSTGLSASSSVYQGSHDSWTYSDCNSTTNYNIANEDCGRWNKYVAISTGHTYALMVNLYGGTSDFSLSWGGPAIGDSQAPTVSSATSSGCAGTVLRVNLSEMVDCTTIQASDFTLSGYTFTINNTNCSGGYTNTVDLNVSPALSNGSYTLNYSGFTDKCSNNASGTKAFTITLYPVAYNVTGGGEFCSGASGVAVGLSDSDNGISYTLYRDGISTGTTASGTGNALSFGTQTTAGTYTVVGSNGCPANMNGNASIVINASPSVTASASVSPFCQGVSVDLSASASGGTPTYSSYNWGSAGSGQTVSVTPNPIIYILGMASVTYNVTVTDSKGCSATDDVSVTVYKNPTPDISGITAICAGSPTTLDAGSYSSYVWNTGATSQTIAPSVGATYLVTVTDSHGCQGTDSHTLNAHALPTVTASADIERCAGQSVAISVSGANTYTWNNGAGSGSPVTVTPATTTTYTVTGTDANGCTNTDQVTVTINANPTVNVTASDATICDGISTNLTATPSGGTPTYNNYNWGSAGSGQTVSVTPNPFFFIFGLASETYTVTVTDSKGCTATDDINITIYENPSPNITGTTAICAGSPTTLDAGSYSSYVWSNTATTQTISVSAAGTYDVTVTDSHGCQGFDSQMISVNALPNVSAGVDALICPGENTTLTATGASSFIWDNSAGNTASVTVTPSATTTYIVEGTDANGCKNTDDVSVVVKPIPNVNAGSDLEICIGLNATLTANNPDAANVSWNQSITDGLAFTPPLGSSTYIVTADLNGCINKDTVEILTHSLPLANAGTDQSICFGQSTQIDAGGSSGFGSISYNWNNGLGNGQSHQITPSVSGDYIVTVSDGHSCNQTDTLHVELNNLPTIHWTSPSEICFGDTLVIDASASTGYSSLTFTWSDATQNDSLITIPSYTTSYYLTITDGHLCSIHDTVEVIINELPAFDTPTINSVSNCVVPNGSITVNGLGGTPAYEYNIDGGSFSSQNQFSNLNSIVYQLGIKDSKGCLWHQDFAISNSSGLSIVQVNSDAIQCHGDSSSNIVIIPSTSNVWYSIDNGLTLSQDSIFANQTAGNYQIFIIDSTTSCVASQALTIYQPSILQNQFVSTNLLCHNDGSGQIISQQTGGTWPYTIIWPNDTLTGLSANTWYPIDITDANNCVLKDSVMLSQPEVFQSNTISTTGVSCNGFQNGSIAVGLIGGTPIYQMQWAHTSVQDTALVNLSGGVYYFTATDHNGCTFSDSIQISEPAALTANSIVNNALCNQATGDVTIDVTGGTGTYQFEWSHDANIDTNFVSQLSPGSYQVEISDQNLCTTLVQLSVINYTTGTMSQAVVSPITCNGANNGQIIAQIAGGTPQYQYIWYYEGVLFNQSNTNSSSDTISNLSSGHYYYMINDSMGCSSASDSVYLSEPVLLQSTATVSHIRCYNENNGAIHVILNGGTAPYQIAWSTGDTTQTISQLSEGTYTVSMVDALNCDFAVQTYQIVNPSVLVLNLDTVGQPLCYNSQNGFIEYTIQGGRPEYSYALNGKNVAYTHFGQLESGTYVFSVVDTSGCFVRDTVVLYQPNAIQVDGISQVSNNEGQISTTVIGGIPSYQYNWSNGANTAFVEGLIAGDYTVTVTDSKGCNAYSLFKIEIPLFIPSVITPNADGVNDTWEILGIQAFDKIEIHIFNRWGDEVYSYSGSGMGYADQSVNWDGTWNGLELALGTFVYILDTKGQDKTYQGVVTIVR